MTKQIFFSYSTIPHKSEAPPSDPSPLAKDHSPTERRRGQPDVWRVRDAAGGGAVAVGQQSAEWQDQQTHEAGMKFGAKLQFNIGGLENSVL